MCNLPKSRSFTNFKRHRQLLGRRLRLQNRDDGGIEQFNAARIERWVHGQDSRRRRAAELGVRIVSQAMIANGGNGSRSCLAMLVCGRNLR